MNHKNFQAALILVSLAALVLSTVPASGQEQYLVVARGNDFSDARVQAVQEAGGSRRWLIRVGENGGQLLQGD